MPPGTPMSHPRGARCLSRQPRTAVPTRTVRQSAPLRHLSRGAHVVTTRGGDPIGTTSAEGLDGYRGGSHCRCSTRVGQAHPGSGERLMTAGQGVSVPCPAKGAPTRDRRYRLRRVLRPGAEPRCLLTNAPGAQNAVDMQGDPALEPVPNRRCRAVPWSPNAAGRGDRLTPAARGRLRLDRRRAPSSARSVFEQIYPEDRPVRFTPHVIGLRRRSRRRRGRVCGWRCRARC